mmetsp:Transcript_27442/g.38617  ORF Transcript_27442/g.38617 Transcript_27442/m.38617 type:complete len:218 (-) Transcript_27442:427-1080(-)
MLVWRLLPSMAVPSWLPSPRVVDNSLPVSLLATRPTLPLLLEPLPVPCTFVRLLSFTESLSSFTLTIAKRPGCPGLMDLWPPTRNTSRRTVSPFSLLTCLIFQRNPSKRTLPSARNTWSVSPSATSFLSSSLVSLEEKKMVLTTLMLTHPVFTLSPRKFSTLTNSFLKLRMPCSLVPLLSEMSTVFTPLVMSSSSPSFSTTPRLTSKRSSAVMIPSQ